MFKNENETREIIEKLTGMKFLKVSRFLNNKYELDGFCEELSMAFEYQGEQHYHPIELFGGEEGLRDTQRRDALKEAKSKNNGVKIVYFKYSETLDLPHVRARLAAKGFLDRS